MSHRERLVEVLVRPDQQDAAWERFEARAGASLRLAAVNATLDVSEIYAGTSIT